MIAAEKENFLSATLSQEKIIAVAPMMGYTDRHCRYLHRLLNPKAVLYTEMLTAQAALSERSAQYLAFDPQEQPLVLQLGGNNPEKLTQAAVRARSMGYTSINLNCGCPSSRVQKGLFGASLMKKPRLVAQCIRAMRENSNLTISVKHRLGLDRVQDYNFVYDFVAEVAAAGCQTFVVHARNAILSGFSPADNRNIPPLQYEEVYRLKQDFPQLQMIINGGIQTVSAVQEHLRHTDGVMIGRQAYRQPYFLAELYQVLYSHADFPIARAEVETAFFHYAEKQLQQGSSLAQILRPLSGLYCGHAGARSWRRWLSEKMQQKENNTVQSVTLQLAQLKKTWQEQKSVVIRYTQST